MNPFALRALPADAAEAAAGWLQAQQARKTVDEAAGAARLVGGIFIGLGALLILPVFVARLRGGLQYWAVANAVMLVGPGVWYVFAATLLRRLDRRAALVALRVAAGQGIAVAAGLLTAAVVRRGELAQLAAPAFMAMFFMPALAALAYQFRRARDAINVLGGGEVGFEPLAPVPVIPLARGEVDNPPGPTPVQSHPSDTGGGPPLPRIS